MTRLTALVEVFKAAVWPGSLLILVYLLRGAIADLAASVREGKVKYKDLEFGFTRDLADAKASLANVPGHPAAEKSPAEGDLVALAHVSPRAAILEAWLKVETAGARAVKRARLDELPHQLRSPVMFGEVLRRSELIPTEVMKAISKLRVIRKRTADAADFQPSLDDAEEYVVLAMAVCADLDHAVPEIGTSVKLKD